VPVTWSLSTVSTLKAGTYYFEGKVNGYNGSVILTLIVDPLPSKVDKLTAEVVLGDTYSLPDTVTVTMSDNTTEEFPVTWTTTMGLLNKVGTYTFQGAVDGTNLKAALALKVSEDSAVEFNDYNLEWVIREEVGKRNSSYPVYKSDVLKIRHLDAEGEGISDLTGIESLTNLKTLDLEDNALNGEALTSLQKLTNLQSLNLEDNAIDQIAALKSLTTLTELNVSGNAIDDFSPLKGLFRLKRLYLSGNNTRDYSPIRVFYDQLEDTDFTL
jgi:Leucine-rich repeat (LRR) protein